MSTHGVFGVNEGGLFDEVMHTQGGLPHLVQHLWDAYTEHLKERLEEKKKRGEAVVTLVQAKLKAPAADFAQFCAAYLMEHRPVENFFIDSNNGVRLSNNAMVAISPGTVIQGTMQDSGAVSVTEGRGQKGNEGVSPSTSLRI